MGDLCNMNDIDRFLRCRKGKAHLKKIVAMLKGRTITVVKVRQRSALRDDHAMS